MPLKILGVDMHVHVHVSTQRKIVPTLMLAHFESFGHRSKLGPGGRVTRPFVKTCCFIHETFVNKTL